MRKTAFTLAEIMIVLSVIAILTAILLPSARNVVPNEKVMKFKKGHEILYKAMNELVTSDKYYLNGDLGIRINGDLIDGTNEGDFQYFCNSMSDVLATKENNCNNVEFAEIIHNFFTCHSEYVDYNDCIKDSEVSCTNLSYQAKDRFIKLQDGIIIYEATPQTTFGLKHENGTRIFNWSQNGNGGFEYVWKIICVDIDGIPENATWENCVNECPFMYGMRADGKILNGARVNEWLQKSIQQKD